MRYLKNRRWIAIAAAVSCVLGTGAFCAWGEDTGGLSAEQSTVAGAEAPQAKWSVSSAAVTEQSTVAGAEAPQDQRKTESGRIHISWWICPTGGLAEEGHVKPIVDAFETAYPQISVDFRILDDRNGADEIREALGASGSDADAGEDASDSNAAPDVVLAAPEYIVTEWGNGGYMADLGDLWDEETRSQFRTEMLNVSRSRSDVWYAVPLYRDLYTMAINYDMFDEAGVLQYLNEEVHSWKDSGFIDAVLRVHDVLVQSAQEEAEASERGKDDGDGRDSGRDSAAEQESGIVGKVYCKDSVGQRALMCFVENFDKTGLVDEYRSSYQIGKKKIIDVFVMLKNMIGKGIEYDSEMNGDDENEAFLNQEVFLTFNWSAAKQRAAQDAGFRIFPMMYPNSKNIPTLTGPVGALGVVDGADEEKKEAAMAFVRFLMTDEDTYRNTVVTAGCYPARRTINGHALTGLYGNDETMKLYETLNDYYEFYDPTMEGYPMLEEAWPEMLRAFAQGDKIKSSCRDLGDMLNQILEEDYGISMIEMDEEA